VRRISYDRARKSPNVHRHNYIGSYVVDLANVVDMEAIRSSGVKIEIDPLGGASVHFWQSIIERYGIAATIVSDAIDRPFGS
jgi:phosphoglucomutase